MHDLDLNLLTALDVLLDEKSVAQAARRLHLSPSAMSRRLGRIRDALDDPILVRAGQEMVPTARALALRERVRAAVAEARALLTPGADAPTGQLYRSVSIRADDAVSAVLGPPLLRRVRQAGAQVALRFAAEGAESVAELRDGRIDLDIGVQAALGPEIRVQRLLEDRQVLLVSKESPHHGDVTARDFAQMEHVAVSRRGLAAGPADEMLRSRGLERRVCAVVPDQLAAASLVASAEVVALVSWVFARHICQTMPLRWLDTPFDLPRRAVAMAWHPRFDADPAHQWVRDNIREIVAAIA